MKKNYTTPTLKVYQVKSSNILAGSTPGFKNGLAGSGDVKQQFFDFDDMDIEE